jgi:hypothetical protein
VQHGQDNDGIVRWPKVNRVRERVEQGSADIGGDQRKLDWALDDPIEGPIDITEEPR